MESLIQIYFCIYLSRFFFLVFETRSNDSLEGQNIDLKVLDKISSKNELIQLDNGEEYIYKDLSIKSLNCTNSEFDDNPEIKAYIQVKDLTKETKNTRHQKDLEVGIF